MEADGINHPDKRTTTGRDLIRRSPEVVMMPGTGPARLHADTVNDLRRLRQMMRGRWPHAIVATIIGSAVVAILGFRAGHKLYISTGQIRVVAVVPRVLYSSDDKGVPPMFDSFVEAQVALLQSRRVIELAEQNDIWKGSQGSGGPMVFLAPIEVIRNGELITIRATGTDPQSAVNTTRSIIPAFEKLFEESDAASNEKRLLVLQGIQSSKSIELAGIREEISNIARPFGTDDLRPLFEMKQRAVEKFETQIYDAEADLAMLNKRRAAERTIEQPTNDQWATVSQEMASLLHDRDQAMRTVILLRDQGEEQSPQAIQARAVVDVDEKQMEQLAVRLNADRAAGLLSLKPAGRGTSSGADGLPLDPQALQEQVTDLHKRRDQMREEMISVGDQQLKINDLKYKADQAIRDRDAAQERIEQLNTEATINGRLNIVDPGDRPTVASRDTRILFAAAGAAGGGLVGFTAVLMMAVLDRRLRSPEDTGHASPTLRLLGVLPRLPTELTSTADLSRAAHCVTNIRNLLQLHSRATKSKTYVVTSPAALAGKTSLTVALGISYASARVKTLLIDCDLVAGELTHRADKVIYRRIGQILLRNGVVSAEQLATAIQQANESRRRLGEVLVEQGLISQDALDQSLLSQNDEQIGILDALDGLPLEQCITSSGIKNLSILPVGSASGRDVPMLSANAMARLLRSARRSFDVVLIDTGPIPGSLEAQLVASVADASILVLTEGVKRPMVRRCVDRLGEVGSNIAGMVYNRANQSQILMYTSESQTSQSRSNLPAAFDAQPLRAHPNLKRFGPLASAVGHQSMQKVSKP